MRIVQNVLDLTKVYGENLVLFHILVMVEQISIFMYKYTYNFGLLVSFIWRWRILHLLYSKSNIEKWARMNQEQLLISSQKGYEEKGNTWWYGLNTWWWGFSLLFYCEEVGYSYHRCLNASGGRRTVAPDPSDFYLHVFPKLKSHLRGRRFDSDNNVICAVEGYISSQIADFFREGSQSFNIGGQSALKFTGTTVEK